ncbi:peptidoglycan D,D-transpeptidase FtsI family protein [Bacillus velezensis]|uniref:serine-type D-Ala-D-Ala carboxypeptidase n=1 Tax=Bacillus amyloliquefaciens TaxID=1390 RepID=A0AAP3YBG6_BACAM|nr:MULTISPECIES: penicillin-binding protein 2 [Bacillus]AIU82499.1 Penicillin-binding protein H [Bacillus velezensis]ASK59099.1 penicillin-binding protein 2 [Bacillus velezensis]ATD73696.1 Penicillin-binding protein H [Bacillus velezensis]ATV23460.1 penicillin-binding protein 2 [Bacillus sp. Lzh-5]MBY0033582.1 penicillin-binding protein 2 [Bacillus velezensis]
MRRNKKKIAVNKEKKKSLPIRLNFLFLVAFLIFTWIIVELGIKQIVQGDDYKNAANKQEESDVSTAVPRGKIYDRNLNPIVTNKALNAITYTRSASTTQAQRLKIAKKLSGMIKVSTKKVTERDKKDYWMLTRPDEAKKLITAEENQKAEDKKLSDDDLYQLQLKRITDKQLNELTSKDMQILAIKRQMDSGYSLTPQYIKNEGVSAKEMAVVSEHLDELPGVDVTSDWERSYPNKGLLKSVLGSVSSSNEGLPSNLLEHYLSLGYSRNDRVGKSYLEYQYENLLQGQKEKVRNVTDSSGNVTDTETVSKGKAGDDLVLTIDTELQKDVEKIIEKNLRAAKARPSTQLLDRAFVVMMDPRNGEVLTMAGKQIKQVDGKYKIDDYALGTMTSSYNMGSAVKGATLLTGYQTGAIKIGNIFTDEVLNIKGSPPKKSVSVMGPINDLTALERSSNVYMFKTAIAIGKGKYISGHSLPLDYSAFDKFRYYFSEFGLGVKTGIDLPNEATGYVGTKRQSGFLLDFAIGQYDTYTPLQMAQYVSTIANGGYRMKPQVVKEVRKPSKKGIGAVVESVNPEVMNRLDMTESEIKRVQQGFKLVMNGAQGTARANFANKSYNPAGKTGTAQAFYDGPIKSRTGAYTYNTTLVAYAPADHPEVAISVVVPWAYEDYNDRYSITNDIGEAALDKYFELKKKQEDNNTKQKNEDKIQEDAENGNTNN